MDLTIDEINNRIINEFDRSIFDSLQDNNLLGDYKNTPSVKKKIKIFGTILEKYKLSEFQKKGIINDICQELIPAGTKGCIRGNKFNKIIKDKILEMKFADEYEIEFEKQFSLYKLNEIPDWYIYNKKLNYLIIGMNQIDLWSGGQQLNRGSKYIIDKQESEVVSNIKIKLLCVVCNSVTLRTYKNKSYKIFNIGFKNNTLCYVNNLYKIISDFMK